MFLIFKKVFGRLKGVGFKLKVKKCCLFVKKVIYFGYVVLVERVVMDLVKIVVVEYWLFFINIIEVCFFLVM